MPTVVAIKERKEPKRAGLSYAGYSKPKEFLVTFDENAEPEDAIVAEGGASDDTIPSLGDAYSDTDFSMVAERFDARNLPDDNTRYIVTVYYAPERINQGQSTAQRAAISSFSFDTGSETKHISQANTNTEQDKSFDSTGPNAPLSKGLIGWDGEKVQGVDISTGAFRFSLTKKYVASEITRAYLLLLSAHSWSVNFGAFGSWENTGEVLFEGAKGRYIGGGTAKSAGDTTNTLGNFGNITGVTSENSDNGNLYVTVAKITGVDAYIIRLYQKAILGSFNLVASNEYATISDEVLLTQQNASGISGSLSLLRYVYDTDDIIIQFPFPWEITYNFAVSEEVASKAIGDVTITDKEGWEYADVRYAADTVVNGGVTLAIQKAKYVYLHKVYPEYDLSFLLLGDDILPADVT